MSCACCVVGAVLPLNNISNSGWRADAFDVLDSLVSEAGARGIYVIIDMHGAVGGQSTSGDTGQQNNNSYWTNGNNQGNTSYMWWQIANHYNGNGTVAGYDLINEPTGAPNNQAVINAQNELYQTVRSADPNHIVIIEGTWGSWTWSMRCRLPAVWLDERRVRDARVPVQPVGGRRWNRVRPTR